MAEGARSFEATKVIDPSSEVTTSNCCFNLIMTTTASVILNQASLPADEEEEARDDEVVTKPDDDPDDDDDDDMASVNSSEYGEVTFHEPKMMEEEFHEAAEELVDSSSSLAAAPPAGIVVNVVTENVDIVDVVMKKDVDGSHDRDGASKSPSPTEATDASTSTADPSPEGEPETDPELDPEPCTEKQVERSDTPTAVVHVVEDSIDIDDDAFLPNATEGSQLRIVVPDSPPPNTGIHIKPLSPPGEGFEVGMSGIALSSQYSPSSHAPKYSQSQLDAKIDIRILAAEKDWMDKYGYKQETETSAPTTTTAIDVDARDYEQELQDQANDMKEEYDAQMAELRNEFEDTMKKERLAWEKSNEEMSSTLQLNASKDVETRNEFEETMKKERLAWETKANEEMASSTLQLSVSKDDEMQELRNKIVQFESEQSSVDAKHKQQIQQVRAENASEIEDVLSQLDVVEAEHHEKHRLSELQVAQKDAIISALGTQLAEANSVTGALQKEQEMAISRVKVAEAKAATANEQVQQLESTIHKLDLDHGKELKEERDKRRVACEEVKVDMIQEAEAQFATANAHYLKLKSEHETAKDNARVMERDLASAKAESAKAMKEKKTIQVDFAAEVSQLKAALATEEAKLLQYKKEQSVQLEELTVELAEAKANCTAAHSSLASLVMEKEKMIKENVDLNGVCEELMAMVEGLQQ
uniref:Uncharacterized protein n=1 Tax=Attheya septentrionalis TaxID=420275 RepID=A0A7S2USE7_9STRA|mmetsp:Transcript_8011/g.14436  ORF Transcript_8011/g.14436 Transcript_8011/m.14436 type:complete len:701 (+) Transcript_8011:109-2211(+)